MDKARISSHQLFCLIVLFELGSAVVVGIGLRAKQDAWLAVLLGMTCGMPAYLLYIALFKRYPNHPLTAYIPKILGRAVGLPVAFGYILYFLYISSRVLRDFGELLTTFALTETPMLAVNGLMMLLIVYGAYRGIEVIGRTGEPILFIMLSLLAAGVAAVVITGKVEPDHLLPFLENGWKPVLSAAFPQTLTFPFGEMLVFTMLLPELNRPGAAIRTGLLAILTSGLILSAVIAIDIAVLGEQGAARSLFPLVAAFNKVNIGDFIQRLDMLVIVMLIMGMFFKIIIFFYAGLAGVLQMFRIEKDKHRISVILFLGAGCLIYSLFMAGSFSEHIEIGLKWVPLHLHLPLQFGIPLLLLMIASIRSHIKSRAGSQRIP
jgi:spore germination protein KB